MSAIINELKIENSNIFIQNIYDQNLHTELYKYVQFHQQCISEAYAKQREKNMKLQIWVCFAKPWSEREGLGIISQNQTYKGTKQKFNLKVCTHNNMHAYWCVFVLAHVHTGVYMCYHAHMLFLHLYLFSLFLPKHPSISITPLPHPQYNLTTTLSSYPHNPPSVFLSTKSPLYLISDT